MKKIYKSDINVLVDLINRYYCFHKGIEFSEIKCWGLLNWGSISKQLKRGLIKTEYKSTNKICWYQPTDQTINIYIAPFIKFVDENYRVINACDIEFIFVNWLTNNNLK